MTTVAWPDEMTPATASLYTGYSTGYLRVLKCSGKLEAIKRGHKKQSRVMFRKVDLDNYLESQGKAHVKEAV